MAKTCRRRWHHARRLHTARERAVRLRSRGQSRRRSQSCARARRRQESPLTLGLGLRLPSLLRQRPGSARQTPTSSASTAWVTCWSSSRTTACRRGLTETFYELQLAGLTPILTHPERNPTLQADPQRMIDWLRGGLLVQVTADSVTGHMGKKAQQDGASIFWKNAGSTSSPPTPTTSPPGRRACARRTTGREQVWARTTRTRSASANPTGGLQGKPFGRRRKSRCDLYEEPRSRRAGGSGFSRHGNVFERSAKAPARHRPPASAR